MLLLSFTAGAEDYAVESRRVVEVLPLVHPRPIPHLPPHLPGVFTHRGRLVPLVDMGRLLTGRPLRERLGTRVIVVQIQAAAGSVERLGMAAENVLSLRPSPAPDTAGTPLRLATAPYLGPVLRIDGRTVQMIAVDHLLPPGFTLEPAPAAAPAPPPPTGVRY